MSRRLFAQLSRESFVYGLSAALAKLVGLVLVPLYTHVLVPADFGVLNLLTPLTGVLSALLILGLDTATAISFYQTEDARERRVIASTFLYFELALAFGVCAGLFVLALPLARLLFGDPAFTGYVQLSVATVPFATFVAMFLDIARLVRLPLRYLGVALGNLLLTSILIVIAVVGLRLGVAGVLWGTLLGSAIFSLAGWWVTRPQYTLVLDLAMLRRLLRLGLPLVTSPLALWVINFSAGWFLLYLASAEQVAIYALAAKLVAPVVLIVTAFQIAWVPFSLSIAQNTAAPPVYARTLSYFLAGTLGTLLLLTLFARPIIQVVFTPFYLPAAQILALVGLSSIASGAYYIVAIGVNLTGRTLHIGWTTVLAAVVNLGLNLALIPLFGIAGAAGASLVANLIPVVLLYIVAQRLYPIPYDLPRVGVLVGASALFLAAGTLLDIPSPVLDWALRLALLGAFGALLLALGIVRVHHLREMGRRVQGAMRRGAGVRP